MESRPRPTPPDKVWFGLDFGQGFLTMLIPARFVHLHAKYGIEGQLSFDEAKEYLRLVGECKVLYEEHFRRKADTTHL